MADLRWVNQTGARAIQHLLGEAFRQMIEANSAPSEATEPVSVLRTSTESCSTMLGENNRQEPR
jgi:hypothetical protein